MLLVQITLGGTVHYISDEYLDVEHFYEAKVSSLANLRISTSKEYGGYAAPTYGGIDLLPDLFEGNWPPPSTCPIKIYVGDTGETGAVMLFDGTAYLSTIERENVSYSLYGNDITTEVADYLYSGTLNSVFTAACTALGLTLNTDYARITSPTIYWQTSGTTKLIDNLSTIAESFSHRFYIQSGVLYLVDVLRDNGATLSLTEFDIFPSSYTMPDPLKEVTARYKGTPIYIGLFISSCGGANYAQFAELKFFDEAGTELDNIATGSTGYLSEEYHHYYSSDSNLGTKWVSNVFPSDTAIQEIWGQPAKLGLARGYSIVAANEDFNPGTPMTWVLKGYDASVGQWAEISTEKQTTAWTANEERKFSIGDLYYDVRVAGSSSFGNEVEVNPIASDVYATISTCLADIKTTLERHRIKIAVPLLTSTLPKIGQKVTLTDESLYQTTSVWARVASLVIDFDNDQCVIEGEGAIS